MPGINMYHENTITATYDGVEDSTYYFTDDDRNTYSFQDIEQEVLESYDLSNEFLIGLKFQVSYRIEGSLNGETYETYIIVNLSVLE